MIQGYINNNYGEFLEQFYIYENKDSLKLSAIVLNKEKREAGIGTKIMTDVINYADKSGKIVVLTPSSDYGGAKQRLIKFYRSFGFVMNRAHNKDFRFKDTMIRYPKGMNENINIIKKFLKEEIDLHVTDESPDTTTILVKYNERNAGIIMVAKANAENTLEIVGVKFQEDYETLFILNEAVKSLWGMFTGVNSIIVAPKPEGIQFWNKLGFTRISSNYLILNRGH